MSAAKPRKITTWRYWRIRGQGLVEYALIILTMAIAMLVILAFIGQTVFVDMYSRISSAFPTPR